jgi:hypothetical protein
VIWEIDFHPAFDPEYEELAEAVQDELLGHLRLLEQFGPQLGRPRVDTLNGSRHANMKELRFDAADGVWRFAFASIQTGTESSYTAATNQEAAKNVSTGN